MTLVVLDIETTGLNPDKDDILEIGAILLDENENAHRTFWGLGFVTRRAEQVSPFVTEMHTKNGLWEDCEAGGKPLPELDAAFAAWLTRYNIQGAVMVGHSVHFDHNFIMRRMPLSAKHFSHRVRDIGAFARTCRDWGIAVPELPEMPHRAMRDCEIELDGYRALKAVLQGPNEAAKSRHATDLTAAELAGECAESYHGI